MKIFLKKNDFHTLLCFFDHRSSYAEISFPISILLKHLIMKWEKNWIMLGKFINKIENESILMS